MSQWFEITGYSRFEIVPVEIISSTEKTVMVRVKGWNNTFSERRHKRGTDFHETREAAFTEVIARFDRAIARLRLASSEKLKAEFLAAEKA